MPYKTVALTWLSYRPAISYIYGKRVLNIDRAIISDKMNIKDSFKAFANRVKHALRMGRLPEKDIKTVERLLAKTEKKNLILSRALLSAFAGGEQSEQDEKRFAHLLDLANRRLEESKEPFSSEEKKELEEMFKRHSLSAKAARKFALNMDELLALELSKQLEKEPLVPKRQEMRQPEEAKKEERGKLLH